MPSKYAYNLGAVKGIGSSTRMYQFCRETSQQPWTCIDQFITINPPINTIPVPGIMKAVFLLELTAGAVNLIDINFQTTLNYFWNTYPQEFIKCPIVDTEGSLNKTLSLLDEYYGYGFKYFIGFSSSNILTGVLNWFNFHPDAIGITSLAASTTLSIPKNIFRTAPNNKYRIEGIKNEIINARNVYYIYESGLIAATNILYLLQQSPYNLVLDTDLFIYPATIDNLTDSNIINFLTGSNSNDIIIVFFANLSQEYISLYSGTLDFSGYQYDITASVGLPSITGTAAAKLLNKYNAITFEGFNNSILWRNGCNYLGLEIYNFNALNILQMLNIYSIKNSINNINSHYGILQFDPVTKDILYPSILIKIFKNGDNGYNFYNNYLYFTDPILGSYNATFTNPSPPLENIPTPSYTPYGKAIALLELTNYSNNIDTIYNESLYYYWYNNSNFPKFPIIDTASSIENTLALLNTYYDQGYRIFLGFSRSSVLTAVVYWFNQRPDAVGISLWSTASSLNNVSRNIYRTTPTDDTIVNAVLPYLPTKDVGNVYYIYTEGELAAIDVLKILNDNLSLNVIPYAINASNLNVHDLQVFFSDATSNDVTLLYIFEEQPYFDLFNASPPLTFPGTQYDIANSQLPEINGVAQTELNNKLYYIQNTYSNTSLLWRKNTGYLTAQANGTITTSTGLANALNMIDYFQKGKNVGLLATYSAVLQFNSYKDIMFPSFLFRLYQKNSNSFVQSSISFDDPLLGSFEATFAT